MREQLSLLIVGDHIDIRNHIENGMRNQDVYRFNLFEAKNGVEVMKVIKEQQIDVILHEVSMANTNGLVVIKELKYLKKQIPVIIFSIHLEVSFIKKAYLNGVSGFLLKTSHPEEIIKAIKTVLTGKKYFINEVANILFEDLDAKTKNQRIYLDNPILSKREVQIIHFYAKQFTTKNIATSLNISKRTIEGHRRNIYKKTGINSIAELIAFANDIGFSE